MKTLKVAFVGQPNVGKSLLVNTICKANMHVGNFAGVTVEKAEAALVFENYKIKIIDLPGTYSLHGYSKEEKITRNFLENGEYDLIVNIADSTNLERNLLLSAELMETNKKIVLALNMSDEAENEGIKIDTEKMQSLLNIPVILISAQKQKNLHDFLVLIVNTCKKDFAINKRIYGDLIENEISKLSEFLDTKNDENIKSLGFTNRQISKKLLFGDDEIYAFLHDKAIFLELLTLLKRAKERLYKGYDNQNLKEIFMDDTASFVNGVITEAVIYEKPKKPNNTAKIDKILINKYLGLPIFLFLMWVLFQLTFTLGSIPMDYIEALFAAISQSVATHISNETLSSLICDGIIGGVGSVLLFLPNILILFFGISLLETTGYMSRVAFLLDGFFHKFGLHGKSFIPLVTGFGCSVPAFMATRTLKNEKDRLLTLFIINFMSCGARLPVYVLFIGAFAPKEEAGNWLFAIYIFGAIVGLACAKFLRVIVFRGKDEPFVMEMPKYRIPNWRLVWFMIANKAKMYLKKAGTFILAASVLIWFSNMYPKNKQIAAKFDEQIALTQDISKKETLEFEKSNALLQNSYLGKAGKALEPIFAPLGFDWRLSVSLVSGLAAKEVMISTMGVLYSLGDQDENSKSLTGVIKSQIPLSTAVAYLLFVMFYNPCLAASVVFAREAGGLKYLALLFIFTSIVAYIMAFFGRILFSL
ncbi:ferrous iron transport protein B [Campylobacter hominis]|uniref:Ferrous iron transport protein B n=1 Tax=Campylobacter hominis (strain ATCC BAA-381 / DSM 21671 / CCUG 45161 / LMG 19568 / NCTC 13146 / CH001A) TaxID=360107 RepID=A7I0J6_CAMHC|nr:ferrous iron transport protein B [Campylobacter hominis]ABS52149.1 ferrous iron transport protein B [Campylobacter hominis ATCC BAA-381]UAK85130.1 ferrous iron transport protein B [Campylobacter hominis]SUW84584.1 ferrous iron transport protein B [Campylobacter hominis]